MGSAIETAINQTKKIESLLENKFSAQGRGLHEKLSSVEYNLPQSLVSRSRRIASIRNKIVHEDGFIIEDVDAFCKNCEDILLELNEMDSFAALQEEIYKIPVVPLPSHIYFQDDPKSKNSLWVFLGGIIFVFICSYLSTVEFIMGYVGIYWLFYQIINSLIIKRKKYKDYKDDCKEYNFVFYKDSFSKLETGSEKEQINKIDYKAVRKINLIEPSLLELIEIDSGVTETHLIELSGLPETPKEICKKIYSFIFREPINQSRNQEPIGVSNTTVKGASVAVATSAFALNSMSNSESDDINEFHSNSEQLIDDDYQINPATGYPMNGALDTAGNPYGTDNSSNSMDDSFSSMDDSFSSIDDSFSSIEDSFSSIDDSSTI